MQTHAHSKWSSLFPDLSMECPLGFQGRCQGIRRVFESRTKGIAYNLENMTFVVLDGLT
jgi:hypothetical protein